MAEAVLHAWIASGRQIAEVWSGEPERLGKALGHPHIVFRDIGALRSPLPDAPATADTLFTLFTLRIVPPRLIERFGRRGVNFHPALLPFYKGAVPRLAMLKEEAAGRHGGVTAHVIESGLDEGPIIAQAAVRLGPTETGPAWEDRLALAAARLMVVDVVAFLDGRGRAVPQDPEAGFYRRRIPGEFLIDSQKSVAEAEKILWTGRRTVFVCRPDGGFSGRSHTFVNRFGRRLGPPTGKAAVWTPFRAELDLADGRVSLLRPSPGDKIMAAFRRRRRIRRARSIGRAAQL
ncbi:hypothetical protein FAZ78_00715 [Cereibacter changlensis]|uniref:phosphoribosylglycinamide formyltransferase 1 n=1 Tax=Cereibacter changlensis TaxID=402884 RepID=A0A4U0Z2I8_9RHOB|nr:formyltransferase family protein [Cereibacter changlensis]TKA98468.1 hypothetical protein FAZ78_00715 [Cereibacter changlensis]